MQHDRDAVADQPGVEFDTVIPGDDQGAGSTGRLFSGHVR